MKVLVPYILCTGFSCLCTFIHAHLPRSKKKIDIWIALAIIVPCILAGARDFGVGTDTIVYGNSVFYYACSHSFFDFYRHNLGVEPLYLLLVYSISVFTHNIFWQYFVIELIIIVFTYFALADNGVERHSWVGMLVFHLMFYSFTLNLMRQFIAMSIILWGFRYVREQKIFKFCIVTLIAYLFHQTGVVGFSIYIIYTLTVINRFKSRWLNTLIIKFRWLWNILMIGACFAVIYFARYVFTFISSFKSSYVRQILNLKSYRVSLASLVFMFLFTAAFIFFSHILTCESKSHKYYSILFILSTILWQIQGISAESYRVVLYIWYFSILAVPDLLKKIQKRTNRYVVILFYILFLNLYYYWLFVVQLYNNTYPYTSRILGIE